MHDSINNIVRQARQAIGMTTSEAAQLVHASRRTWESWEASTHPIPPAKLELFVEKITKLSTEPRQLLVVLRDDQIPLDVIASDTFLSIHQLDINRAVIRSLANYRSTGRPYVHETVFNIAPHNKHVLKLAEKWKSVG